jgi:hypothetical protein
MNFEDVRKNLMLCVNILKGVQLSEARKRKLRNHRRNANESLVEKTNRRRERNETLRRQEGEIKLKKERSI